MMISSLRYRDVTVVGWWCMYAEGLVLGGNLTQVHVRQLGHHAKGPSFQVFVTLLKHRYHMHTTAVGYLHQATFTPCTRLCTETW